MKAVGKGLRARFDSNRRKLGESHSTCVILKKAHSLDTCIPLLMLDAVKFHNGLLDDEARAETGM